MRQFIVYKNILTAQLPTIVDFFQKIFNENNFDAIIEIGTNRGGLTLWINDHKKKNTKLYTFEKYKEFLQINPNQIDGEIIIDDIFSKESVDKVKNIIENNGQCLILCDGGFKNEEFNLFSKFLKKNDIIMLHDYMDNIDEYRAIQANTGWETEYESNLESIKQSVEDNKLEKYLYQTAKENLWGSFKKV